MTSNSTLLNLPLFFPLEGRKEGGVLKKCHCICHQKKFDTSIFIFAFRCIFFELFLLLNFCTPCLFPTIAVQSVTKMTIIVDETDVVFLEKSESAITNRGCYLKNQSYCPASESGGKRSRFVLLDVLDKYFYLI